MSNLFSDSLAAPRYVDGSSTSYRYPITFGTDADYPTRSLRFGYRSMPIAVTSRLLEITWTFRTAHNRGGVTSLYVWKTPTDVRSKQPNQNPAIYLEKLGGMWFGEIKLAPTYVSGSVAKTTILVDDSIDFVQIYTSQDIVSLAISENTTIDAATTVLYPPLTLDPVTRIADDFELQHAGSVVTLIEDTFELGNTTQPNYGA